MSNLHVAHKRVGGVADILNLLADKGESIHYINESGYNIDFKGFDKIYFHQPKSHLFFCGALLSRRINADKATIILHEASHYSFSVTNLKSYLYTFLRFFLINLISIFVRCKAVSTYVSNSYFQNFETISYCYLYKNVLESLKRYDVKQDIAVIWVRKDDFQKNIDLLNQNPFLFRQFKYLVLGEKLDVKKIKETLCTLGFDYFDLDNKISFYDFLGFLNQSKIFISLYSKEGFGLSVFFAAYFGNAILASKKGATGQWLPSLNFELMDYLLKKQENKAIEKNLAVYMNLVSIINVDKCLDIIDEKI